MADVRLTATNPEDSSVVPVACNEKGELKLEEPPSFDGTLDGDLSVTGSATVGGTATFDDDVLLGKGGTGGNTGITLRKDGSFISGRDQTYGPIRTFLNSTDGVKPFGLGIGNDLSAVTSGLKTYLFADGSASFAGNVGIKTDDPKAELHVEGRIIAWSSTETIRFKSARTGESDIFTLWGAAADINSGTNVFTVNGDGSGEFAGELTVASRGQRFVLVEQGGLCHMVAASQFDAPDIDSADEQQFPAAGIDSADEQQFPAAGINSAGGHDYPDLRDVFKELDLIESALREVMDRLRMTPPAGWEVWDGSDK